LQAAARVWARAGASGIVIAARRLDALEKVASELTAISPSSKILSVKADITSEEQVKNLYASVQKTFGRHADVLLNNAGYLKDDNLIGETAPDEWWTTMVNSFSPQVEVIANTYRRKSTSRALIL
jgi:NADP-dependent 3-hydroxy acid dehydrogenase YdfG